MGKTRARISTVLRILINLSILSSVLFPLYAETGSMPSSVQGKRLVRVGWFETPGLQDGQTPETVGGYNYEYLVKIAQYENWTYQFVFGDWTNLEQKLINGEIDLIGDVAKTSSRLQKYSYCDYPNGYSRLLIACRPYDSRFSFNDYEHLNGATVAMVESSFRRQLLSREASRHHFSIKYRIYPRETAVFDALKKGEADVAAFSDVTRYSGLKIISELEPNPYYFVVSKKHPEILAELNNGLMQIQSTDLFMQERLFRKYFGSNSAASSTALTDNEISYVISKPKVRVLLAPDEMPLSYKSNGAAAGIIPSYFEILTGITGLSFEFIVCSSYSDMLARFSRGEAELCAQLPDSFSFEQSLSAKFTQPYIDLTFGIISYSSDIRSLRTIALCEGKYWLAERVRGFGLIPVFYPSNRAALDAVAEKKADGAAMSSLLYEQLAYHSKYAGLRLHSETSLGSSLCLAVSRTGDSRLYSILEKGVGSITPATVRNLMISNSSLPQQLTFSDYISRHLVTILIESILIIFLLSLLVILIREKRYRLVLQKANDDTLKANKAMSVFLSNISHDMRTPLNGIIGFTDLALAEPHVEKRQEYLEKIRLSGGLLLNLINDTLELSRIESGKLELNPEPVDAHDLFEDIAVPVRQNAAARNIAVFCELPPPNSGMLMLDRNKVQEIALNLLSNAIKYTLPGGSIRFCAGPLDQPRQGCNYRIAASDTGIGISPEFIPQLFEPFAQEHAPEAKNVEGTGLGLSIVKRIVDLMQGSIEVQSEKGRGSIFTVYLPVGILPPAPSLDLAGRGIPLPEQGIDRPDSSSKAESQKLQDGAGVASSCAPKILLCDDNEMNLEIASLMLKSHGFDVVTAADGRIGFELYRASSPSEFALIITDIRMPNMDGWEFASALRSLSRSDAAAVPIIALTADAFQESIDHCYRAGMNGYVVKPLSADSLFAQISRLLS